ncbi:MAG TPA: AgmX/PglI C-terminal domain-containing protein [Labilithrix sp.]|nr:AgmX/PglI C-terminal domain-containing protein [Labilithrix sp.]
MNGEPKTPYREGKPLAEIIAPDRRRAKTFALVASSMVAGAALWVVGGFVLEQLKADRDLRTAPTTPGYVAGRIAPAVLKGPDHDVAMPPGTLAIVHVWLQGCQDCMPAFEAMRRLEDEGGLGVSVPVYNIAYGEADPTWAMRYGVRTNLAYDVGGSSVVRPLGIATFTTLVVDKNGSVLLRDRPDRPGYRARVRAAVHAEDPRDETTSGDPFAPDEREVLDATSVSRVVAANRVAVKRVCWDRRPSDGRSAAASVSVVATIGTDGRVSSASGSGSDAALAKCVEDQVTTWHFPSPTYPTSVNIPFRFVRE